MPIRYSTVFVGTIATLLAGCGSATIGGKKGFSTANDDLRQRVAKLEDENRRLTTQRDELSAKLAEEDRVRQGLVGADVLAAIPRCVGIELDSLSGLDPLDPSLPVKGAILYVEPFDGEHRFVQIVGTLRAEVVELSDGSEKSATHAIASAVLKPAELRSAYRSGITGTHYEVRVAFPTEQGAELHNKTLLLRVRFEDALTGEVREASVNVGARSNPVKAD